jgi:hypothetical protein
VLGVFYSRKVCVKDPVQTITLFAPADPVATGCGDLIPAHQFHLSPILDNKALIAEEDTLQWPSQIMSSETRAHPASRARKMTLP